MEVITLGIDLDKNLWSVAALDRKGCVVLRIEFDHATEAISATEQRRQVAAPSTKDIE